MKTAAIYTRVSTHNQKKNYSLETQIDACKDYAIENGYEVVAEFTEIESGGKFNRKKLAELRQLVANGVVQVVISYELDRVARNMVHQLLLEEEFKRYGVPIEYARTPFDDTPEGQLQKHIHAILAEYEREKIKERMLRGRTAKVESGLVIRSSIAPYGYRYVGKGKHEGGLEIVPTEAEVVKLIYHLYLHGDETGKRLGYRGILRYLSAQKIPTRFDLHPKGHVAKSAAYGIWSISSVKSILTSETYAGTMYYNKRVQTTDNEGKTHRRLSPKENWLAIPVPAIVSHDTWEAARSQATSNTTNSKRNTKGEYLLRGRLRCGICGTKFYAQAARTFLSKRNKTPRYLPAMYLCKGMKVQSLRGDQEKTCQFIVPTETIDRVVWEAVKDIIQHPDRVFKTMQSQAQDQEAIRKGKEKRYEVVLATIEDVKKQRQTLKQMAMGGQMTVEEFNEDMKTLNASLVALQQELDGIVAEIEYDQDIEKTVALLDGLKLQSEEAADFLDQLPFEEKRRIIDTLDLKATLHRKHDLESSVLTLQGKFVPELLISLRASGEQAQHAKIIIPFYFVIPITR